MATRRNTPRATTPNPPGVFDHDLDRLPRRPSDHGRPAGDEGDPQRYQRLLANPFLGFFGTVVWVGLMQWALRGRRLETFVPAAGSGLLILLLWQYHCLDCGATGHLAHWRQHDCVRVRLRRDLNRPRKLRGPTPVRQTIAWAVLGALGLLIAAATR